jgi:hypothetical protein
MRTNLSAGALFLLSQFAYHLKHFEAFRALIFFHISWQLSCSELFEYRPGAPGARKTASRLKGQCDGNSR